MVKNLLQTLFFTLSLTAVAQVPTITSFTPVSGGVGTAVTITGTNFSAIPANNIVYFGSVKATVTAAAATSITVTAPGGSDSKPISVTIDYLTAYASKSFSYTFQKQQELASVPFSVSSEYVTGKNPQQPALGDFDGDGKPEIAVVNKDANTVAVFQNISSGSVIIGNKTTYATLSAPADLAIQDMDGDGKLDLIVVGFKIMFFKNTSSGSVISFAPRLDVDAFTSSGVLISDFDKDGKPDVVLNTKVLGVGYASVYKNITTPGGQFSVDAVKKFQIADSPGIFAIADLDNDEKTDIISTNIIDKKVSVLRNTSTSGLISFASNADMADVNGNSLSTSDLDGDGKSDMAISRLAETSPGSGTYNNVISVLKNNSSTGAISFAAQTDILIDQTYSALSDVDGDGKSDLAASGQSGVFILKNTSAGGTISFDPKINVPFNNFFGKVRAGDLNGDGRPDLVVTCDVGDGKMIVIENTIDKPSISYFVPAFARSGATVLITGKNFSNATAVLFGGTAAASFEVVSSTSIKAVVGAGSSGNVNVTTPAGSAGKNGFSIYTGTDIYSLIPAKGKPGSTVTITGSGFSTTAAENIVRFGSTVAEVISATGTELKVKVPQGSLFQSVTVTANNQTAYSAQSFNVVFQPQGTSSFSSSSFALKKDFNVPDNPGHLIAGDFDRDGKADIAVVRVGANKISILKNTSVAGTVTLVSSLDLNTGTTPEKIQTGDFDSDGKLDLAVVNSSSNNISIFRNISSSGTLAFEPKVDFTTPTNPQSIAVRDINHDGKPDVAITCFTSSNYVSVFQNTTSGTTISFAARTDYTAGSFPSGVALCDLNLDGLPEMIVSNSSGHTISTFRNTSSVSSVSFADPVTNTFYENSAPYDIVADDLNQDGYPDVLTVNSSNKLNFFKNAQTGSFLFEETRAVGNGAGAVTLGDHNGDGSIDAYTANSSTSSTISVIRSISAGASAESFDAGSGADDIICVDLDNDWLPEIITANRSAASISVLLNKLPVLDSFTPAVGGTGTTVTITGSNLSQITAVRFGGLAAASFKVDSENTITAVLGSGSSGAVTIISSKATLALDGFTYVAAPTITTFAPKTAVTGGTVTITGTNFTGATAVTFGGISAASFSVASATSITAVVGTGASGEIAVTTPGGTAKLGGFTFNTITGIEPVTIYEPGFTIFPNPSQGQISLQLNALWEGTPAIVEMKDLSGRKLISKTIICKPTVDFEEGKLVETGLYLITVLHEKTKITRKVMITH